MTVPDNKEEIRRSFSQAGVPLRDKLREALSIFMVDFHQHYFGSSGLPEILSGIEEYPKLWAEFGGGGDWSQAKVLEIGYGPRATRLIAMISLGIDARGIDVDLPVLAGRFNEFARIYRTNGLERALKSAVGYFCFGLLERRRLTRELAKRGCCLRTDASRFLVGDAAATDFAGGTFDLIVSENVFEHIAENSLHALVPKMARWLKPAGLALIRLDVFTGLRGGHLAEWFQIGEPGTRRRSEPWEHLRKKRFHPNTYLNKLSRADYRNMFSKHFHILEEKVMDSNLARRYLTPDIARELRGYSEEELLGGNVLFVMRSRT